MNLNRNFETLYRRLRASTVSGGRPGPRLVEDSLTQVQIIDDLTPLMVPMQRVAMGVTSVGAAVAARLSWTGIVAINRPVRLLYVRPSATLFCGVVPYANVISFAANMVNAQPIWWENGDVTVAAPITNALPVGFDTAADLIGVGTAPSITATAVQEPRAMPLIMPGQCFLMGSGVVLTVATAMFLYEVFQDLDGSAIAP